MITKIGSSTICVVGVGYVGLPLSKAFARSHNVISFDIDVNKIKTLSEGNEESNHSFTNDPEQISEADLISICVPTPLTKEMKLDMSYIKEAAAVVGRHMKKGAIVVVESSVCPGTTEEVLKPILEQTSGYECGKDFRLAYSPERINPGDTEHDIDKVTKIVAASDEDTLNIVANLYRDIVPKVFKVRDIRAAEAAKLVENAQRDLNIAFVNELALMFQKMGINTQDVLDAAATKWNFLRLNPGLVGGYCIPVAPHFLAQKAEECGYRPQVILAGRAVNSYMPRHLVDMTIKSINDACKVIKGAKVLIMGCTYKENIADTRETPIRDVIKGLHEYGIEVYGYDPLVEDGEKDFGIKFFKTFGEISNMDCILLIVAHDNFKWISPNNFRGIMNSSPIVIDIKGLFDSREMDDCGIIYKRL